MRHVVGSVRFQPVTPFTYTKSTFKWYIVDKLTRLIRQLCDTNGGVIGIINGVDILQERISDL